MKPNDSISLVCGSKHGACERCYQEAELKRVKVNSFDGMPKYQYLCAKCAAMEKIIKC